MISVAFTKLFGESFFSAVVSLFRRCAEIIGSLATIFSAMVTYGVRYISWPVLLKLATGLEGYRFKIPVIEQLPSNVPEHFVKYEDLPEGPKQRALSKRSAWVSGHLGDVSQTFSKLTITAADISSLLRIVEADQTLVHAAYYTDDECVARIADWIAGRA